MTTSCEWDNGGLGVKNVLVEKRETTVEEIVSYNVKQHSSVHNVFFSFSFFRKFERERTRIRANTVSNIVKQLYIRFPITWPSSGTWASSPWRIHLILSTRLVSEIPRTYINRLGQLFYRAETCSKRKQYRATSVSTAAIWHCTRVHRNLY